MGFGNAPIGELERSYFMKEKFEAINEYEKQYEEMFGYKPDIETVCAEMEITEEDYRKYKKNEILKTDDNYKADKTEFLYNLVKNYIDNYYIFEAYELTELKEDAIQEVFLACWKGLNNLDDRAPQYIQEEYFSVYIHGALQRFLSYNRFFIKIPDYLFQVYLSIKKHEKRYENMVGFKPDISTVCAELEITEQKYRNAMQIQQIENQVSINEEIINSQLIDYTDDIVQSIDQRSIIDELERRFTDKEKKIFSYLEDGYGSTKISEKIGVSRATVNNRRRKMEEKYQKVKKEMALVC